MVHKTIMQRAEGYTLNALGEAFAEVRVQIGNIIDDCHDERFTTAEIAEELEELIKEME